MAPSDLLSEIPEQVPEDYLLDHYYDQMFKEYSDKVHGSDDANFSKASKTTMSPCAPPKHEGNITRMFDSTTDESVSLDDPSCGMTEVLAQGLHNAESVTVEHKETTWLSVAQLFNGDCYGNAWKFDGVIVEFDQQPRTFERQTPQKRRISKGNGKVSNSSETYVMNVTLADRSGPVILNLWDAAADAFLRQIQNKNEEQNKLILRVEHLRIADIPSNDYNGNILTTMKALHSVTESPALLGTTLSLVEIPSSPFMTSHVYSAPTAHACISQYFSVKSQLVPPFRATLRGVLQDVQVGEVTQTGQAKCTFALVDEMGSWLQCCAIGRNASGKNLENGNEVVLYYASGRKGTGINDGMVWLFKESMIIKVGRKNVQKRMQIELK